MRPDPLIPQSSDSTRRKIFVVVDILEYRRVRSFEPGSVGSCCTSATSAGMLTMSALRLHRVSDAHQLRIDTRNHMTLTWPTAPSTSFRPFPFLIDISYPLQAPITVTSTSSPPLHPSRSIKRPSYASFCTQYCTSRAFLRNPTITITTDIYFFRVPVSPCQAQIVPFRENVARLTRFTLTNYNHIFPKVQHSTVTDLS
jgi:hypothetical protein